MRALCVAGRGRVCACRCPLPAACAGMLNAHDHHLWGPNGPGGAFITPNYYFYHLGGSELYYPRTVVPSDQRNHLSFWGDNGGTPGGCCHSTQTGTDVGAWSRAYVLEVAYVSAVSASPTELPTEAPTDAPSSSPSGESFVDRNAVASVRVVALNRFTCVDFGHHDHLHAHHHHRSVLVVWHCRARGRCGPHLGQWVFAFGEGAGVRRQGCMRTRGAAGFRHSASSRRSDCHVQRRPVRVERRFDLGRWHGHVQRRAGHQWIRVAERQPGVSCVRKARRRRE